MLNSELFKGTRNNRNLFFGNEEYTMKKLIALLLAVIMVASLAACGNQSSNEPEEAVDYSNMTLEELKAEIKTVNEGKLTVATSPDFAPYEFYALDDNGDPTLAGFDVALAQYIAEQLGLELEVIPMDFDGTISELGNKTVDLGLAGYSPDPERESLMNFSDLYYKGGQSFVTVNAKADEMTSMEVANDAKYQIGAQVGSIQVDLAKQNTPDADIVELTKVTDIIAELLAGTLDGAFIETAVAESYQKNYPELKIVCDVPYDQEGSAVGVNKDNAALLAAVNLIIAQALEDGTIDQFVADANELASGNVYEGLLDENGKAAEG